MTMLLTLAIIVFGIITYKQLAVNDLPAVDYPVIQVNASYPGANPETMANTIATPLEKQFTQIPGLTLTTSSSTQGNTSITLQFDLSKTIDSAATDVQSAIQRATSGGDCRGTKWTRSRRRGSDTRRVRFSAIGPSPTHVS